MILEILSKSLRANSDIFTYLRRAISMKTLTRETLTVGLAKSEASKRQPAKEGEKEWKRLSANLILMKLFLRATS